jgi:hypothetical protein
MILPVLLLKRDDRTVKWRGLSLTKKPVFQTAAVIEDSRARIAHHGPGFAHTEAEYICADHPVTEFQL